MTRDEMLEYLLLEGESYFILKTMHHTDDNGWGCEPLRKSVGDKVKGLHFHSEVSDAIRIELSNGDEWYINYKDLVPFDSSILDSKNESFLFEVENLNV